MTQPLKSFALSFLIISFSFTKQAIFQLIIGNFTTHPQKFNANLSWRRSVSTLHLMRNGQDHPYVDFIATLPSL
jgi:hypothetical protein